LREHRSSGDLLDYFVDQARWLAMRWSLGPVSGRSIETDKDGSPLLVQVTCERARITWRHADGIMEGPLIEPNGQA
jgi:hypothetical protein